MNMASVITSEDTSMEQALPHTQASIAKNLGDIGLSKGDTVLVHTSLRRIGFTVGGAQAVVQALMNTVTESGTIVMPTFTDGAGYSDPLNWHNPPVQREWAEHVRMNIPRFNPDTTPSVDMGAVNELFRTYPNVRRNNHPIVSYAAWGWNADPILSDHTLGMMDGEQSPLARIYDFNGKILLIGVGYGNCTSIHLATHRQNDPPMTIVSVPTWDTSGQVHWDGYPEVVNPGDMDKALVEKFNIRFSDIGAAFEKNHAATVKNVGSAESRLISQRALVDFATEWFNDHPYRAQTIP